MADIAASAARGEPIESVARRHGLGAATVWRWARDAGVVFASRRWERLRASGDARALAEARARMRENGRKGGRPAGSGDVEVPGWVPDAFHESYVSIAEQRGEEEAASRARRWKRERAGAAGEARP